MFTYSIALVPTSDAQFLKTFYLVIIECLQNVVYYEKFKSLKEIKKQHIAWFHVTLNAYQQVSVIKWNSLFNLHGNEKKTNYKNLTRYGAKLKEIGIKDPSIDNILKYILNAARMNCDEYEQLKNHLTNYRDKYVSHRDIKYLESKENNLSHPFIRPIGIVTWGLYILLKKLLATYPTLPIPNDQIPNCELWYISYDTFEEFEAMLNKMLLPFISRNEPIVNL